MHRSSASARNHEKKSYILHSRLSTRVLVSLALLWIGRAQVCLITIHPVISKHLIGSRVLRSEPAAWIRCGSRSSSRPVTGSSSATHRTSLIKRETSLAYQRMKALRLAFGDLAVVHVLSSERGGVPGECHGILQFLLFTCFSKQLVFLVCMLSVCSSTYLTDTLRWW